MRVLLQHPIDDALCGPWTDTRWDLIVDFGWSGRCSYFQLSQRLRCRVVNYRDLLSPELYRDQLRELLHVGLGNILDSEGIDWWDVFIPYSSPSLQDIMLMAVLAKELNADAEIVATRPHCLVQTLELLRNSKIKSFAGSKPTGLPMRLRSYARAAIELRPSQLMEVAFDRWDVDYRFRRFVGRRRPALPMPSVLLPSSYGNVSRVQASYARMLPGHRFLQVVTRKSGRIASLPPNLEVRSLASYAPAPFSQVTEKECDGLAKRWDRFQYTSLAGRQELNAARHLGVFTGFKRFLRKGLRIRDAWLRVFQNESINALLSGDENNPYTRIPVILAGTRKIPTTFCPHGALDMSLAVRVPCSDTYLAQGDMARDYWLRWCGLNSARVKVGAPENIISPGLDKGKRDSLVFFSEPYELESGRADRLYEEILPRLCTVAQHTGRQVIVKLHPFESLRARRKVIDRVLSTDQRSFIKIVEGLLTSELLQRAWCGLTVTSSTAVDCALNGIPCFLCSWFDVSWFEYGRQFARFGVARVLNSPEDILGIPRLIQDFEPVPTGQSLAATISREQLGAILLGVSFPARQS